MPARFNQARLTALALKTLLMQPFDRRAWETITGSPLHLRIGNAPVTTDKTQSLDQLEGFLERIEGFGCEYCELWQRREAIYAETDVRFVDEGGRPSAIPCAIVARVAHGLLVDMRLHLDPSPIPDAVRRRLI